MLTLSVYNIQNLNKMLNFTASKLNWITVSMIIAYNYYPVYIGIRN